MVEVVVLRGGIEQRKFCECSAVAAEVVAVVGQRGQKHRLGHINSNNYTHHRHHYTQPES